MLKYQSRFRSVSDANMRHASTWVGVKNPSTDTIVPKQISEITGDLQNLRVRFSDGSVLSYDDPLICLKRPELCMVTLLCSNTGKKIAVWLEADPSRQVKRSLDLSQVKTRVLKVFERLVSLRPSVSERNTVSVVSTIFNKLYPSVDSVLEELRGGTAFSIAFSPRFALSLHPAGGIILQYKDYIVGHVEGQRIVLAPHYQYLLEQLGDYYNVDV